MKYDEKPAADANVVDAIGDDIFLQRFFARIPRGVAESFTEPQLDAIKRYFGARSPGVHAVDLRWSVPMPFLRFYLVLLMGREQRTTQRRMADRLMHPVNKLANLVTVSMFGALAMSAFLGVLYAIKSALGIDIFPDGGLHSTFDRLVEQISEAAR